MKYFVGRMKDADRPYRVYSAGKYFDTDEVVFRSDFYWEAKSKSNEFNKLKKIKEPELFVRGIDDPR
jgi:hypothetical protein